MGDDITRSDYSAEDFARFRGVAAHELERLRQMLAEHPFDHANPRAGMELEINLVDDHGGPAHSNAAVLSTINDPNMVPELGVFTIELNLPPFQLGPDGLSTFAHFVRSGLSDAGKRAASHGVRLAVIGILPTLARADLTAEALSDNARYRALDEQLSRRRGRPFEIDIEGVDHLRWQVDTIAPEAACTSHQIHLQVAPDEFASYWNASQAIAGVQLALGANSPFFVDHELWAETRIPLFDQSTDDRTEQEVAEGAPARVCFGDRWIASILDLFEENQARFEPVLPELVEEAEGRAPQAVPQFKALSMLNGTVYRWNRPVYDVAGGQPHVRVENRVLPAGPTVTDMIANAAFYAGLTRALATQDHPVWAEADFATARRNLMAGARDGIDAVLTWPGEGERRAVELVHDTLLPLAASGLEMWGVAPQESRQWLGVIEGRCKARQNGASWQVAAVRAREARGQSRAEALRGMLGDYLALMASNEPVHTWQVPS